MSQHSAACCSIPPVIAQGYKEKGEYVNVGGTKVYATGPATAKRALFVVFDVFGYYPQTLQGADILAYSNTENPFRVFIPDLFEGKPADITWYPPDTKEKGEKLGHFFQTTAAAPAVLPKVAQIHEALKAENLNIASWGIVGYCWGGKIANLSSQKGTPFKAAASCHPAMVDPSDAPNTSIPYCMLPSGDEDKDAVAAWQKGLTVKSVVEWFPDQIHGWMAARGKLEDPKVREGYERGYKILLDFFSENL